ncbi:MAG TPA: phosphatase PAP2 family protein [Ilumatobacteraceae bacterium]|nr:phosphatase PAP2 family protein [Ilumatobacteraceae bacterium]
MTAALQVPRTRTWPLERRDAAVLLGWFIGLVGVWWAVGALITGPLDGSGFVRTDERISQWFADGRTPRNDDLAVAGAMLADTFVKIIVTAVAAAVIYAIWRSWRDVAMIVLPLILEASVFITVTWLVGRPRPDVPRLEDSPVASSWPSGHTAAATVYSAIVVVIWWHVRNRVVRVITVLVPLLVVVIVGWARTYAGMHHLSDVVSGVVLGAVSVFAVWLLLRNRA